MDFHPLASSLEPRAPRYQNGWNSMRRFAVYNVFNDDIPPYAIMQIVGNIDQYGNTNQFFDNIPDGDDGNGSNLGKIVWLVTQPGSSNLAQASQSMSPGQTSANNPPPPMPTNAAMFMVNGPFTIFKNSCGEATRHFPWIVLHNCFTDSLPNGTPCGPISGAWYVSSTGAGFICMGHDSLNASGGTEWGYTVWIERDIGIAADRLVGGVGINPYTAVPSRGIQGYAGITSGSTGAIVPGDIFKIFGNVNNQSNGTIYSIDEVNGFTPQSPDYGAVQIIKNGIYYFSLCVSVYPVPNQSSANNSNDYMPIPLLIGTPFGIQFVLKNKGDARWSNTLYDTFSRVAYAIKLTPGIPTTDNPTPPPIPSYFGNIPYNLHLSGCIQLYAGAKIAIQNVSVYGLAFDISQGPNSEFGFSVANNGNYFSILRVHDWDPPNTDSGLNFPGSNQPSQSPGSPSQQTA